jgi:DNA-binding response OmpR family regulator
LIARIRAILRRTARAPERTASLTVGEFRLDPAAREVSVDGVLLDLTSVEFTLLETLLRDAGHVVTRESLTEIVLGHPLGLFDRVIDVHISNLRKKLSVAHADDRIKAVRGSGYLLAIRSETAK